MAIGIVLTGVSCTTDMNDKLELPYHKVIW